MSRELLQDHIHFSVTEDTVVQNDTIKIVAQISATIQPNAAPDAEDKLRESIREMMNSFIAANWQFSNNTRSTDSSGMERVSLTATTRVSEKENYDLDGRAKKASKVGMAISGVTTDNSIPQDMLDNAQKLLRKNIVAKLQEEAREISELTGRDYRVSTVSFENHSQNFANSKSVRASSMLATQSYGSGFGDDDVLGNAQKLTMTASVVLSVVVEHFLNT